MQFYLNADGNDISSIFIIGNFNKWNPQDKDFLLKKNKKGFSISIADDELPTVIEYKTIFPDKMVESDSFDKGFYSKENYDIERGV